jgi:hypothetical protein
MLLSFCEQLIRVACQFLIFEYSLVNLTLIGGVRNSTQIPGIGKGRSRLRGLLSSRPWFRSVHSSLKNGSNGYPPLKNGLSPQHVN